jgi:diacylglycerol kinase family enzyme
MPSVLFKRAALIYNPASGSRHAERVKMVEAAAAELRAAGVETTFIATRAAGSGGEQAHEAIAAGHDAVFACGGDGTVQDVLQGLAERHADVPLGLVPLGTGNVLAFDLGLPNDPAAAVRAQLQFVPRKIAAGKVEYCEKKSGELRTRYFTVMCGVGADAEMIYRVSAASKSKLGILAYHLETFRTALLHPYQKMKVEYVDSELGERKHLEAFAVAAVRVTTFPGLMGKFAQGAELKRDDLRIIFTLTKNRIWHVAYFLKILAGQSGPVPGMELVHASEVACAPIGDRARRVYAEADGEFLGGLPVKISAVPGAFTLLMRDSN